MSAKYTQAKVKDIFMKYFNLRFVTNPFNMASLFGVGILQFLGKPFSHPGTAICYLLLNIFRNAGGLAAPHGGLQSCKEEEEEPAGV